MTSQKEFEQAIRELGMSLIEDYYKGNWNEKKLQMVEKIIQINDSIKNEEVKKGSK